MAGLNGIWPWIKTSQTVLRTVHIIFNNNGGIVVARTFEANLLPKQNSATFNTPAD